MNTPATGRAARERIRRMRIRLAALKRHAAARDPATGKSRLAVDAGRVSGRGRRGDAAWGLGMSLRRWYPHDNNKKEGN